MATFTNATRNSSTFINLSLGNYATWADDQVAWADSLYEWSTFRGDAFSKQSRNTSTFTNATKN